MKVTGKERRKKIHYRIRKKVKGTSQRPRLSVFRSNKYIYCQAIDDVNGVTLVAASSIDAEIDKSLNKTEQAKMVGQLFGKRALERNLDRVVFDRNGYLYHGRVKALADGAREAGMNF